jgi:hypothetical protein
MAVSVDELLTPLPADGSAVREDLIYFAGLMNWTIPVTPGRGAYQFVNMLGRWGTRLWNTYAIPALRAQFGDTAAGDWLTLWARARGVDRNEATPASAPVTFENRSGLFVDASAVGAIKVSYGGSTYTTQGPAPGSSGTLAIWPGSGPYPQTVLLLQCDVAGTVGSVPANALPGYPTALAAGPPGVYVATSGSSPPAGNPVIVGSNDEPDPALLGRTRDARALGAPVPYDAKLRALVLGTKLESGAAVATNRLRIVPGNGAATIYCATPSGPTTGTAGDPTTELGAINAQVQLLGGVPGLALTVVAAGSLSCNLGVITLYVSAAANVTAAAAQAAGDAALILWTSQVVPVGGFRKSAGGQGWIFADEVLTIAKSRINLTYPLQWKPNAYYAAGDSVANLGQTFTATAPGTSGTIGPTGDGGADGGAGLTWAPTTATSSGSQFELAPGIIRGEMPSFSDTMVSPSQIATFVWSWSIVIVDQGVQV